MKPNVDSHPSVSRHDLRRIAVAASCDPRAVVRYLRDEPIHSTTLPRIESALRSCDLSHLIKTAARPRRDSTPPPPAPASSR